MVHFNRVIIIGQIEREPNFYTDKFPVIKGTVTVQREWKGKVYSSFIPWEATGKVAEMNMHMRPGHYLLEGSLRTFKADDGKYRLAFAAHKLELLDGGQSDIASAGDPSDSVPF